jgi:hypothetical protein
VQILVTFVALSLFGALCSWAQVRHARGRADAEVESFASMVPAPLTSEVAAWLRPQLLRRTLYPRLGAIWGIVVANLLHSPEWSGVAWYWFATLVGVGVGSSVGTLVAGLRTEPLVDGPTRVVDPLRRRTTTHFARARVLQLRLGLVVAVAGVVLATALAASSGSRTAVAALVACGLGAVLVGADLWLVATVLGRPMVASSPEGQVWHRALVAKTVDGFPQAALVTGVGTAALALYAAVVDPAEPGSAVLVLAVAVPLLAAAAVAAVLLVDRADKQRRYARRPDAPALP